MKLTETVNIYTFKKHFQNAWHSVWHNNTHFVNVNYFKLDSSISKLLG